MKQDLLPPSYFDPKRTRKKGPGALAPVILPQSKPSVPTATVAIKVLHPRVNKLIERDLSIMSFFAHLLTLFPGMQWVSLPEEIEVFGRMMHGQLDLRKEADNLVAFERNFMARQSPVTFPRPLQIWSTSDILVEEYQTAIPLEWFLKNGGGPYDDQLAELGLDAFLVRDICYYMSVLKPFHQNMLLLDNFVHSDLHPGNIMVKFSRSTPSRVLQTLWTSFFSDNAEDLSNDPTSLESNAIVSDLKSLSPFPAAWRDKLQSLYHDGYLPELVFIDAGLVTTLNAEDRQNFLDLFRAVAEFDGYRAGQLMVERCRTPHLVVDKETFALKMQHLVLSVKRKTFSLGKIKISDILRDVLTSVRQHHVKMEGDFINTVISILLLEGIGRQLDPKLDLFKSSLPILRQLGREMTTRENMARLPDGHFASLLKVTHLWQ
jgi:aarF domain-containing kinase